MKLPKAWESWRTISEKDPKRLSKLVEAGIELRNERKAHEATAEALRKQEAALVNHLIENFDKADLTEVKTKLGTGRLVRKDIPQMDEATGGWEAVYAYIVRPGVEHGLDQIVLSSVVPKTTLKNLVQSMMKAIARHGNWELLHKRLGERACQERWAEKEQIPGVRAFTQVTIKLGDAE